MTKYVFVNNIRKSSVRLGISTKVFKFLAEKALDKCDLIEVDKDTDILVSTKNNGKIATFKLTSKLANNANKDEAKQQFLEHLGNVMNFMCDSIPYEVSVKLVEKKA